MSIIGKLIVSVEERAAWLKLRFHDKNHTPHNKLHGSVDSWCELDFSFNSVTGSLSVVIRETTRTKAACRTREIGCDLSPENVKQVQLLLTGTNPIMGEHLHV